MTIMTLGLGWRDELYTVYAQPSSSGLKSVESGKPFSNAAFALERSACAVFGLATFGVHMTGEPTSAFSSTTTTTEYLGVYEGEGDDLKIWVPRRAKTKATCDLCFVIINDHAEVWTGGRAD